ncbi:hypothetical protein RND71_026242 [Anisodus tanguticus]|uniref:Remorin C-terminal domain-containing protein n=1 Tax=Anisodus tanguticus TaxID=243964 RepID=A0AAE1RNJ1_9SOLA|nr:hypothetical protein RND71_026242 [Anisodus tanguticus]
MSVLDESFTKEKLKGIHRKRYVSEDKNLTGTPEPTKARENLDTALAQLNTDKKSAFIKAWEEAQKKLSKVAAWKNSKKAHLDAKLKKLEERLEQKKAEYAEKMKNKAALIHKEAEEKKAMVEAKRGEQILKTEEMAAKYRATGQTPKKLFGCVG